MAATLRSYEGAINPDALYREAEAAGRMGWGKHALTAAKKRGLKILKVGKCNYVLGSSLVAYVEQFGRPVQDQETATVQD